MIMLELNRYFVGDGDGNYEIMDIINGFHRGFGVWWIPRPVNV